MNNITRKLIEDKLSYEKRNLIEIDFAINRLENDLSETQQNKSKIVQTIESLEKDLNK